MRRHLPKLVLAALLLAEVQPGFAQVLARAQAMQPHRSRKAQQELRTVLQDLKNHYKVDILFFDRVVSGYRVPVDAVKWEASLETNLEAILRPLGLTYKTTRSQGYVITKETAEKTVGQNRTGFVPDNGPEATQPALNETLSTLTLDARQAAVFAVRGRVTDENGEGLPGVTVLVKGTTNGTTTDVKGAYTLNAPDGSATLTFSSIGYASVEMAIGNRQTIDVKMVPDVKSLSEVVVVGYGVQKKINVTGSVSAIESKDIVQKPVGQLSTALQGVAPGVTITQRSGQPGADAGAINIRGIGTLNNNAPLVLVDGIQFNINDVDPNDVESISVLKDAAAASIYGVRAANGVILITTKRGLSDQLKVSYSNYFGWQKPTRLPNYVGAQQYMQLVNLLNTNSGGGSIFTNDAINQYNNPNRNTDLYPDNYWIGDILTGSGFQQEHSVAVAGGNKRNRYRFSTNYFDQNGLVKRTDFQRLTLRLNTDITLTDKLTFSADISTRLSDRNEPQSGTGTLSDGMWFQFGQAAVTNPLQVIRYSDGIWGKGRDGNPIRLQEEGGTYTYKNNLMSGNFRLNYEILKGLSLSGIASVNYSAGFDSYRNKRLAYTDFTTKQVYFSQGLNELTKRYTGNWFRNFQGLAEYKKAIGSHSFNVLGGISTLGENNDQLTGYRRDINGDLSQIDAGAVEGQRANGTAYAYNILSFFGRVNYSYKDKYLLEANIRRDGTSRFAENKRWGTFPSFSAGWRISAEEFMQSVKAFQDLKLRASWGRLGNHELASASNTIRSNYPYQSLINLGSSYSYPFGGTINPGAALTAYPNTNLGWETSDMADIGLDATVLKGKLSFTFDYYVKNTNDVLLQLPIPSSVGLSAPYQNAGSIRNRGWEFSVNYRDRLKKDFTYGIGFNISDVHNEITNLQNADYITQDNDNRVRAYQVGQPIGAFFGYQAEGIFKTADEVAAHATQPGNVAPGDLKFKDQNGDGVINASDRVVLGSDIPRYTYGINLNAGFKNFDLSAFFQGVAKVDINTIVMKKAPTSPDGNFRQIHLDSWTPDNPDAKFPRLSTYNYNYVSSSYWIESGAYLRLKTVQLGYTVPSTLIKRIGLSRGRVFVGGQNLLTFSKLQKDIDPESPNESRYYPQVKIYTFGFNLDI